MNAAPIPGTNVLRVPSRPGERQGQKQAGDQFRRALQERTADAEDDSPAPDPRAADKPVPAISAPPNALGIQRPTARGLQHPLPGGRKEQHVPPRHVDLLA